MSNRYKGSIMSSTQATSSLLAASGVWKQTEVAQLIASGWPNPNIDPYWTSVSMLLHGDGTNGAQNNTFIDSSGNSVVLTRSGSATQGSYSAYAATAPYSSAAGSLYLSGTSDYVSIAASANFSYSGDFTWECWVYPITRPSQSCVIDYWIGNSPSQTIGQCQLTYLSTGAAQFVYATSASAFTVTNTAAGLVPLATWTHLAVVRSGTATGNVKIYVNGALGATVSGAITGTLGASAAGSFGRTTSDSTSLMNGYISNARIVKGTAVYTAPFTPPTSPVTAISGTSLLANFTNAGIYDNAMQNDLVTVGTAQVSTSVYKYGTGSMAFSGSGAWLTTADKTSLQLGTGDFTIEGWVYLNATGTAYGIVSKGAASSGWSVNVTAGNLLSFGYTATALTGTTALSATTWYYFAVVRSGSGTGNLKIYLNGTLEATSSGAVTDAFTQTNIMYVGANRIGATPLNGYVDDLRITKGIARYTANFTPSAVSFPNQ